MNTCPVCNEPVDQELRPGRPRLYCSDGHRRVAEAERGRLVARLKLLDRRRVDALEHVALRPNSEGYKALLAVLDAEIASTSEELARITAAGGPTPESRHD